MCINVFEKEINDYYRDICLLSFAIVIIFSNNIATYIILGIMYLIFNFKIEKMYVYLLIIMTLLIFIINNMMLIKIILSIDYVLYFLLIEEKRKKNLYFDNIYEENNKKITNFLGKGEIDNKIKNDIYHKTIDEMKKRNENRLLRFDNDNYYDTKSNCYYVIIHLIILFLSILLGSCVI